jgi:hypothetical protein
MLVKTMELAGGARSLRGEVWAALGRLIDGLPVRFDRAREALVRSGGAFVEVRPGITVRQGLGSPGFRGV